MSKYIFYAMFYLVNSLGCCGCGFHLWWSYD